MPNQRHQTNNINVCFLLQLPRWWLYWPPPRPKLDFPLRTGAGYLKLNGIMTGFEPAAVQFRGWTCRPQLQGRFCSGLSFLFSKG